MEMPPLIEEFMAVLAAVPAVDKTSFEPWGIAGMLYKSEAIGAFGFTLLLDFEGFPQVSVEGPRGKS